MQLMDYFEHAHIASAAFWREFDRVLGGANPFECVMGDWDESHRCLSSKLANRFIETAKDVVLSRTISYLIPGCINARTRGTFVWRIIAEGAVESPDFVIIVDRIKCRSCTLRS